MRGGRRDRRSLSPPCCEERTPRMVASREEGAVIEHRFHRHDALVLVGGAVLVAIGVLVQPGAGAGAAVTYATLERDGLLVRYPQSAAWFPPASTGYPAVITSVQCSSDPRVACAHLPTARIALRVYDD